MGVKLESFLRVMGSALSPQAAQANTAQYAAEQADERLQQTEARSDIRTAKANDFKMGIKTVAVRVEAMKAANKAGDKAAFQKLGDSIKTYADENFDPDQATQLKNLAGSEWMEGTEKPKTEKTAVMFDLPDGGQVPAVQRGSKFVYRNEQGQEVDLPFGSTKSATKQLTGQLGKKTKNKIQDTLIKTKDNLSRLGEIKRTYKENFLTYKTRIGEVFSAVKEQAGFKLNKEDRIKLGEFAKFRRKTFSFLNEYIHDMSGAAVSVQEAVRMKKALPTMDDSPTEYISKMEDLMSELEAKQSRYEYWVANGLVDEGTKDKSLRSLESEFPQQAFAGINKARAAIANSEDPQARDKALSRLTPWFEKNGYDIRLLDSL